MKLVDKQVAIEEIKKWRDAEVTTGDLGTGMRVGCDKAITVLNNLPVVEEREKAHWVSLEPEIGLYGCSKCEHKILRAKCNYCPNCGRDMSENVESGGINEADK